MASQGPQSLLWTPLCWHESRPMRVPLVSRHLGEVLLPVAAVSPSASLSSGRSLLRFQPGLRRLARCTCLSRSKNMDGKPNLARSNTATSVVASCQLRSFVQCSELAGGHGCDLNAQGRASPCPRVLEEF